MLRDIVNKLKKEILKEATGDGTGARGSYVMPLRPGKRLFDKNELAPFTTPVSDYDSQLLATDSYDGVMDTPKKDIKKIEAIAKKASEFAKKHPIRNDDDGEVINPFPGSHLKMLDPKKVGKPYNSKINESEEIEKDMEIWYNNLSEADSSVTAGLYTGPVELGIRKWKKNNLTPFTEFVDSEVNHKKVTSTTKNNIKRQVGVWEKDADGSYEIETGEVHTLNEDLAVWFGTKKKPKGSKQPKGPWVNICKKVDGKHPPCGRPEATDRAYPKCRAAGVAGKMSDDEKKAACSQKRRAEKTHPKSGTGNPPKMVSYKPKKKSQKESLDSIIFRVLKEEVSRLSRG